MYNSEPVVRKSASVEGNNTNRWANIKRSMVDIWMALNRGSLFVSFLPLFSLTSLPSYSSTKPCLDYRANAHKNMWTTPGRLEVMMDCHPFFLRADNEVTGNRKRKQDVCFGIHGHSRNDQDEHVFSAKYFWGRCSMRSYQSLCLRLIIGGFDASPSKCSWTRNPWGLFIVWCYVLYFYWTCRQQF